jgi:hypothetical protein
MSPHFHPSLHNLSGGEVHLFWVLCKTLQCTDPDISLPVVPYKLNEDRVPIVSAILSVIFCGL